MEYKEERILNLTQHPASKEQLEAGVFEPANKEEVKTLLTFGDIPSISEMGDRAIALMSLSKKGGAETVLIGGAPFFMSTLELVLKENGIKPIYAFSKRESIETTLPSGEVVKKSIFKHIGFVES